MTVHLYVCVCLQVSLENEICELHNIFGACWGLWEWSDW